MNLTTLAEGRTRTSQAPYAVVTYKPTAGKTFLSQYARVLAASTTASLLVFRPTRRPLYPANATTQPHLRLRRAHGLLRYLLHSFRALCRRLETAPRAPPSSARAREPVLLAPLHQRREPALRAPPPSVTALFRRESLRLGRRSSQPRHKSPCTTRRPPKPRAAQYSDCCACTSLLSAKVSNSSTSRPCGGGWSEVQKN